MLQPSSGEMSGFKIKIKIGGTTSNSPSVMVTDNKTSPVDTSLKHETSMSPLQRPEIPKL